MENNISAYTDVSVKLSNKLAEHKTQNTMFFMKERDYITPIRGFKSSTEFKKKV